MSSGNEESVQSVKHTCEMGPKNSGDPARAMALKLRKQKDKRAAIRADKLSAKITASGAVIIDREEVTTRWNKLQNELGLTTANDVAMLLIDRYR